MSAWHRICISTYMVEEKYMNNQKVNENTVLLDLVSNNKVNWVFVKLCAVYKYVGIFI